MSDPQPDIDRIARQIVDSPRLRAKCFRSEGKAIAEVVSKRGWFAKRLDLESTGKILARMREMMNEAPEGASSVHAEEVMQQFFEEAIRNPERSFNWNLRLSVATFLTGVALIIVGVVAMFRDGQSVSQYVLSGVFGGSGAAATLGSLYTMARRGVGLANANHAQIRLVLATFATELGHLRAIDIKNFDDACKVNDKIREAMSDAVEKIGTHVRV